MNAYTRYKIRVAHDYIAYDKGKYIGRYDAEMIKELRELWSKGVLWWKYVLKEPGASNKMLHELAREIRAVEIKRGKPFTLTQYKTIFSKWADASRLFLRKGLDYFVEFLAKLSIVTMPNGETLESAFQRSVRREPPSKVLGVPSQKITVICEPLPRASRDVRRSAYHAVSS